MCALLQDSTESVWVVQLLLGLYFYTLAAETESSQSHTESIHHLPQL